MGPTSDPEGDRLTTEQLDQQLQRMRGMLFGYSQLFFVHMRVYTLVAIGLLVASLWEPLGGAVLIVPFLVPFVFLEASYLFWYTVFARRHAEWVERALAARGGSGIPAAHRLEAAFFYAPDDPKIAALDLRRPLSHMSAATLAYSAGAGLLWLSGLILGLDWIEGQTEALPLLDWVPALAVIWTAGIALYLVYTWLRRPDERRLVEELDAVYPASAGSQPGGHPDGGEAG
ncbi:MAG: hypothetical protein PVH07_09790 [Chloroflexota bacterium]|jgi:hypothetical protein